MNPMERTILRQLFASQTYAERVVPYMKDVYFQSNASALIFKMYAAFFDKYHCAPQFAVIRIGLDSLPLLTEAEASAASQVLDAVEAEAPLADDQQEWLLTQTEEWCQDRAVYVGLQECIKVMDDPKVSRHAMTDILKEALSVSFDTHIGHDFINDAETRWDFYHKAESRVPFDLAVFNNMTKGGTPKKTLNVVLAGTNVGKSLFLVHHAAACLRQNKNVLYITMEMAEEWIAQRIDANMMDIPMDDVEILPREVYAKRMKHIQSTTTGRIIIKEYPTGAGHCGHFRSLIQELRLKENFVPDVIFVDYISICASAHMKMGNNVNSYTYNKSVAEELRGLGVEFNVPIWSAAQFNREGFMSSDPGLGNVGESFGIPQTADFMFAIVQTEELEKIGQVIIQPLKNRYKKKNTYSSQMMGMDTSRMKLFDLNTTATELTLPTKAAATPDSPLKSKLRARRPMASLRSENPDSTS